MQRARSRKITGRNGRLEQIITTDGPGRSITDYDHAGRMTRHHRHHNGVLVLVQHFTPSGSIHAEHYNVATGKYKRTEYYTKRPARPTLRKRRK